MIIEFENFVISPDKLKWFWVVETDGIPGFSMKTEAESLNPDDGANTIRALMKIQESLVRNPADNVLTEDFRDDRNTFKS